MKRDKLADRVSYLRNKQDDLERAAEEHVNAQKAPAASLGQRRDARRSLMEAGIALGLACKRYLGGRE